MGGALGGGGLDICPRLERYELSAHAEQQGAQLGGLCPAAALDAPEAQAADLAWCAPRLLCARLYYAAVRS